MLTDDKAAEMSGKELTTELEKANQEIATAAYNLAMKCLGDMVETGSLLIRLNF